MERLTFRKAFKSHSPSTVICVDGYIEIVEGEIGSLSPFDEKRHYYLIGEAVDKLAEYEDAEEKGLLVPVVHGRWVREPRVWKNGKTGKEVTAYRCSACEDYFVDAPCRYCPNCGAKMDGKE